MVHKTRLRPATASLLLPFLGLLPALAILAPGNANASTGTVVSGVVTSFQYPSFLDVSDLSLVGVAAQVTPPGGVGPLVRLTSSTIGAGALWRKEKAFVEGEFSTTFVFDINTLGALPGLPPGGDGFAFVIQNQSATAIGQGGCELGYGGILRGLAVEFDTFKNDYYCQLGETSSNQVSVHVNKLSPSGPLSPNESTSIADTGYDLPMLLKAGGPHTVKISYQNQDLQVFVDDMVNPVIDVAVDLGEAIELEQGRAWIGFTASDASSWANFDIRSWSYDGVAGGAAGCVSSEISAPLGAVTCLRGGNEVCTKTGWEQVSAGCEEKTTCSCAGVEASNGQMLVTTRCGARACAGGHRIVCTEGDWVDTGADCTGAELPEMSRFPEMKVACGDSGTFCGRSAYIQNGSNNTLYTCPGLGMAPVRAVNCGKAYCTLDPDGDRCATDDAAGNSGSSVVDPSVTCQAKGLFCGGYHVNGGDPDTLYNCDGADAIAVPQRGCSLGCKVNTASTAGDKCHGPVPLTPGGADADCFVTVDDQAGLKCPTSPGCYGDQASVKLPLCGKHLINLIAELAPGTAGAGPRTIRANMLDAAGAPVDPSNLYICDAPGAPPRLAGSGANEPDGHCTTAPISPGYAFEKRGCRSRDMISNNPYNRDSCCTVMNPRCDASHDAPPTAAAPIGAMAACFYKGHYCGSNIDKVQYGDPSTLYDCNPLWKTLGHAPTGALACAHGCLQGGGENGDDACVPTCAAAGAFCGADTLPGGQPAVLDGAPGSLYYCASAGATPVRVPCSACAPGGGGASVALSLAPGADKTCPVIPFCTSGDGLFCGGTGDVLTGENGALYQCSGAGKEATPVARCGAGKCDPGPADSLPPLAACTLLDNVCPPGTNADGSYTKRNAVAPYNVAPYTDKDRIRSRFYCNGHVLRGRIGGVVDSDPRHLYECKQGGATPVLVDECSSSCQISTQQLNFGDHDGCSTPQSTSCHHDKAVTALPQRPDVMNYIVWGGFEQDRCSSSVIYPPQSCQLGPICAAPSDSPLCGDHGITCGRPDTLYTCDDTDPEYPLAKPVEHCGEGRCAITLPPAMDFCADPGQPLPKLCTNPLGQPGYYCGSHDVQDGLANVLYYCDYPPNSSFPAEPVAPSPMAAPPDVPGPHNPKGSLDCDWYLPGGPPPSPVCLALPGSSDVSAGVTRHKDLCNNPAAALASAWKWWEIKSPSTRVFESAKKDTYDTDLVPSGTGVEVSDDALDVKVTFPHPSAYLGTVGDRDTAEWGYAPIFLDMTTRRTFALFHLRHPSADFPQYDPKALTLCEIYQAGTVVGYMGGGNPAKIPKDAATGYPTRSSGQHFCVQYGVTANEAPLDTWNALVGTPQSPPPLLPHDLAIVNTRVPPSRRNAEPCQSLIQTVLGGP